MLFEEEQYEILIFFESSPSYAQIFFGLRSKKIAFFCP